MISSGSDRSMDDLVTSLVAHQLAECAALRRNRIDEANRSSRSASQAVTALIARGAQGRQALEDLLSHPTAFIRLRAAGAILSWNPERAVPVLGRLLVDELGDETSPFERIDIRVSANGYLYAHFGIDDFDRDRLIEPLRGYGIELPRRKR